MTSSWFFILQLLVPRPTNKLEDAPFRLSNTSYLVYAQLHSLPGRHLHRNHKTHHTVLTWTYLLTTIRWTPCDSSTVHIYTQTAHRKTQLTSLLEGFLELEPRVVKITGNNAGRAASLRVIPCNLPYT